MKSLLTFDNLSTPHKGVLRKQEIGTKLSKCIQKRYRSGVRTLLFIMNLSQLELSNSVCELSKCMYEANMAYYKSLLHEIM